MFILLYSILNLLLVSTVIVCKTTTTTQKPQNGSMETGDIAQKSVKIIHSCDVGTTNINDDSSAENHCIYEQSPNGLCFYFGNEISTYKEASRQCAKRGMELASITKPHILDLLARMINERNFTENTYFWVNVPNSTWDSIGNWSTYYTKYYNSCDAKYRSESEEKACPFLMLKPSNKKTVLRQMQDDEDCVLKFNVFCQDNVTRPMTKQTLPIPSVENDVKPPTLIIIAASSVGMIVLLIIVGLIIKSLLKAKIHSHNRMENAKSDTSEIEEKRSEERYSIVKDPDYDALNNTKADEYADYAELDDDDSKVEEQTNNKWNDADRIPPASACDNAQDGDDREEPCYFVLNKESSTESLQHTYEDCAFKDVPSTSSLQMVSNPLALTLPVVRKTEETEENLYDWPDLLQPTNFSAQTRRTQSETEPQYFSLEIEDNDGSENIYDCVFPIDEPLKKSPKPSRTKHLSLQRKKHKTKQSKGRFSDVTRK